MKRIGQGACKEILFQNFLEYYYVKEIQKVAYFTRSTTQHMRYYIHTRLPWTSKLCWMLIRQNLQKVPVQLRDSLSYTVASLHGGWNMRGDGVFLRFTPPHTHTEH